MRTQGLLGGTTALLLAFSGLSSASPVPADSILAPREAEAAPVPFLPPSINERDLETREAEPEPVHFGKLLETVTGKKAQKAAHVAGDVNNANQPQQQPPPPPSGH